MLLLSIWRVYIQNSWISRYKMENFFPFDGFFLKLKQILKELYGCICTLPPEWSVAWLLPWLQNARWVTVWNWPRLLNSIRDNLLTTTRSHSIAASSLNWTHQCNKATLLQVYIKRKQGGGKIHSLSSNAARDEWQKSEKTKQEHP